MKSIHLQTISSFDLGINNPALVEKMNIIKSICNACLFLRKEQKIRVRMPLSSVTVYFSDFIDISEFTDIIKDEINVKNVILSRDFSSVAKEKLIVDLKKCGQRFGKLTPKIVSDINAGNWIKDRSEVKVGEHILNKDEYTVNLELSDKNNSAACYTNKIVVKLDTSITDELLQEGLTRDLVRLIQQSRKELNLDVTDRIYIDIISKDQAIKEIFSNEGLMEFLSEQTLSIKTTFGDSRKDGLTYFSQLVADNEIEIGIKKS